MGRKKNLLKKFLKGTVSDEEAKKVEMWLDSATQGNNPWENLSEDKKAAFLTDLKSRINTAKLPGKKNTGRSTSWVWLAAASVIILLMIPVYVLWMKPSAEINTKVVIEKVAETNMAQIKQLQLSDGSKVWLNAKSRLRYTDSFGSHSRDVYLDGQAYFEISRDTKRPFVVHTSSWQVTVLGTHFDVSDYMEDNDVTVSVLSGKVAVQSTRQQKTPAAILHPGEQLEYDKRSHELNSEVFAHDQQPSWIRKEVVFYHTKMEDIAGYIKRNYGLAVSFANPSLSETEVSGNFGKIEDAKELLEILCLTINAEYKANGKKILITEMH
ncbi:FecR family protein [Arachidicoccus terrestris]|uniref:FecR family protein n=1 Tax=Arachidicoccus terrestris TaxID=2875539 RepID=UPI001CC41079|nr:FecR domain-containing protein [Arachidicoccus terrestris]UAY56917.1 FecR domain-containing protein [Arachidicoccus terrestris]